MSELRANQPTLRDKSRTVRAVGAVAGKQWGVIDDRQLTNLGIGSSTVWRWAAGGWLYEQYPGVYAVGNPNLCPEGLLTAALFFSGPGSALSHRTAAWWWGLTKFEPPAIEISVPFGCSRSAPDIVFHRRRHFKRTWHRRLPVTTLEQTLLDYAATEPLDDVRYALAEGEYRHDLDLDEVWRALGRGRPGSARLRQALTRHDPRLALTDSWLERAFFALCEAGNLPLPLIGARPCGFKVDAYWPEQRVVVEVDGYDGHHTAAQLARDHRRDLLLRRAGIKPLRYSRREVVLLEPEVLADLTAALYQR